MSPGQWSYGIYPIFNSSLLKVFMCIANDKIKTLFVKRNVWSMEIFIVFIFFFVCLCDPSRYKTKFYETLGNCKRINFFFSESLSRLPFPDMVGYVLLTTVRCSYTRTWYANRQYTLLQSLYEKIFLKYVSSNNFLNFLLFFRNFWKSMSLD